MHQLHSQHLYVGSGGRRTQHEGPFNSIELWAIYLRVFILTPLIQPLLKDGLHHLDAL